MKNNSIKNSVSNSDDSLSDSFNQPDITGYTLLDTLGRGGFSSVYRAEQTSTGQIVAIKVLNLKNIQGEQQKKRIERFKRETLLCAELIHPHIVKLLDKGSISENLVYAVFEYIPGKTLKELLIQNKVRCPVPG